jgi:carbon starvation protein
MEACRSGESAIAAGVFMNNVGSVLAYRFYGRWLARQVVELNNQRVTPAIWLNDGVNFHPTNKVVLFGHHFAAIAGAGPLLGPVLAAQFWFLPRFSGW